MVDQPLDVSQNTLASSVLARPHPVLKSTGTTLDTWEENSEAGSYLKLEDFYVTQL